MKFVINGRFYNQSMTGVQRYATEIVAQLDLICGNLNIEIAVPIGTKIPSFQNIKVVILGKHEGLVWEQIDFSRYVKKQNAVSLNLCNSAPLFGKKIVCIHDVKIKAHPEFFSWKFRKWYSILFRNITKRAIAVITVSEFSKDEIIKYYHCDASKINVIYNAWQHYANIPTSLEAVKKFRLEKGKYIFALGSLEPNKNLKWIFEVAKRNPSEKFAIGGGINTKIFSKRHLSIPSNVVLLGYLQDTEAKSLMENCKYFVFPSFYEGFGIPPMEAMVAGAENIIVSDIPVMHEIFKNSVIYIDPYQYDYLIKQNISHKSDFQDTLAMFSWEQSAEKMYSLLHKVSNMG